MIITYTLTIIKTFACLRMAVEKGIKFYRASFYCDKYCIIHAIASLINDKREMFQTTKNNKQFEKFEKLLEMSRAGDRSCKS